VNIGGVVVGGAWPRTDEKHGRKGKRRETETHEEKRELSTQTKKYTP
jgi:hypothetical protein